MDFGNDKIKVAISCTAYNHEPYIRQCLEGFVMQKTYFKFVAIVHDDASLDKTARIIREYEARYPELIKPIYETENQYSKHDGSLGRIMNEAIIATEADYVALCEGDDYWTDPYKLQKQVDFLDGHLEYVICAHNAYQQFANNTWRIFVNPAFREHNICLSEMLTKWHTPTASLIYRRKALEKVPSTDSFPNGDYYLMLRLLSQGKFYYDPSVMSVYRMHDDSVSAEMNRNTVRMYNDIIRLLNGVRLLYKEEEQPLFDEAIRNYEARKLDFERSTDSVKRWLYSKTYTRALKKIVKKFFKM